MSAYSTHGVLWFSYGQIRRVALAISLTSFILFLKLSLTTTELPAICLLFLKATVDIVTFTMKKILIVKQLHGISLALAVGIFVFLTGILSAYIASSGLASSHLVRVLSGARSPGSRLNIFRFTPQHQYEVQVFSQDPLILYVHNFLNKYEITHLLKARYTFARSSPHSVSQADKQYSYAVKENSSPPRYMEEILNSSMQTPVSQSPLSSSPITSLAVLGSAPSDSVVGRAITQLISNH